MSTVGQHARSSIRWLLSPLLVVVDKRIAWRMQQFDERVSRAERAVSGLADYAQLLAGTLGTPSNGQHAAIELDPEPAGGTEPLLADGAPAAQHDGGTGLLDRLRCPVCEADVQVVPEILAADGRVKRGYVPCDGCGCVVALVRDFRLDFRARGGAIPAAPKSPSVVPVPGELR